MRRAVFFFAVGLLGFGVSAVVVFQVAFLSSVLPHGGIY
jgi:hypothetical protein